MTYYKVCRVRCTLCGEVLEHVNQTKDERGSIFSCTCGKVALDPSAVFYRVVGEPENYEDLSERWEGE